MNPIKTITFQGEMSCWRKTSLDGVVRNKIYKNIKTSATVSWKNNALEISTICQPIKYILKINIWAVYNHSANLTKRRGTLSCSSIIELHARSPFNQCKNQILASKKYFETSTTRPRHHSKQ
ncbi:hypothetical protein HHI36_021872 [Cryptolaemus montrouzieri]|uniref:Uncharacterized protein n=1 Tax=Cryptolaemus montrouzieri TaxID=559131 RepID=A0ABD2MY75_9CUCU